jgi:RNA polymerase sigma-70 factor (ECF subfamily)
VLNAESTTIFAVVVAMLAGLLRVSPPGSFMAALAALRAWVRRGRTVHGTDVIIVWLARMGVAPQERDDLRQEIIARAFRAWPAFDPTRGSGRGETNFVLWLNRIARNVVSHHRGRAHRRRELLAAEPIDAETPGSGPLPYEKLESEHARVAMLTLLQYLPLDLRVVLVAHDIDGIPMAELAEQTGMSLMTLYKRRRRALEQLQQRPTDRAALAAWLAARRAWRDR